VDLKSTQDASEHFAKSCANYGYHRQAAMYLDGLRTLGLDAEHFIFVAAEKAPPYAVGVYELDYDAIERGRDLYRADLELLARCMERDEWPAYSPELVTLSLPRWAA